METTEHGHDGLPSVQGRVGGSAFGTGPPDETDGRASGTALGAPAVPPVGYVPGSGFTVPYL